MMKNFYDTLGVAETATEKEIKNAFKALAKKYHPDQGGDENKFKEINEAYDTLKNSEKRQEYDAMRKYGTRGSGLNQQGNDFFSEDIFQDFLSIKEVYHATEKTISIRLPSGRDEIVHLKIPAGVQNGAVFKYKGLGDDTDKNLERGDLLCTVSVLDSDGYTRKGNDLFTDKTISCFDAIRGTEFKIRTLDERILSVKVSAGTQPDATIVLKGQGMPIHDTLNIKGNMYIKINVLIPELGAKDLEKIKDL
jgi:curved DNA-binding protein